MGNGVEVGWDPRRIDGFLKGLEESIAAAEAKKKAEKTDKEFEKQLDKSKAFVQNVGSLLKLLSPFSGDMKPEDRQKLLEEALTGLLGGLIGEGGDELATAVHDLLDIARGKLTDEEKKQKIEDSIKTLVSKAGTAASGAKDKDVGQIVDAVAIMIKWKTGSLTDAERQKILEDQALKLVTTDLIKRQLVWFVSENFMTHLQAIKIGYQLGRPFGDAIKRDLAPIVKARYGEDFLIALEQNHPGWFDKVTAGSESVKVTLKGSFSGWQGIAFWDYTVNDLRIQVITPKNNVMLLDGNGVDVTGEKPGSGPTEATEAPSAEGEITARAQSNVARAKQIADNDPKVKDLARRMEEWHDKALDTQRRQDEAFRHGDKETAQRLEIQYRMEYSEYWRLREQWKAAIHGWFLKAAKAENWGTPELNYLWQKYPLFGVSRNELALAPAVGGAAAAGVFAMPRSVGRAGVYALVILGLLGLGSYAVGVVGSSREQVAPSPTSQPATAPLAATAASPAAEVIATGASPAAVVAPSPTASPTSTAAGPDTGGTGSYSGGQTTGTLSCYSHYMVAASATVQANGAFTLEIRPDRPADALPRMYSGTIGPTGTFSGTASGSLQSRLIATTRYTARVDGTIRRTATGYELTYTEVITHSAGSFCTRGPENFKGTGTK